jgi:hypothetical protein
MYEPVKHGLTNNRVRQVRAWGEGCVGELSKPAVHCSPSQLPQAMEVHR